MASGRWQPDTEVEGTRDGAPIRWHVPEETPIALVYGGITHVVMLASPADLEDFAFGFTITEGIARRPDEIRKIEVVERAHGIDVMVTLEDTAQERFSLRRDRRNLVGRTGCGLCGIDSMESLYEPVKPVADAPLVPDEGAIAKAVAAFDTLQPLRTLNRSVHGVAWMGLDGTVQMVREDVGRHNALDKLLGARLRSGAGMEEGFVLVSSRASFEMAHKCVMVGVQALVSLSAPTAFAIRIAREANLALMNWSRDGVVTF